MSSLYYTLTLFGLFLASCSSDPQSPVTTHLKQPREIPPSIIDAAPIPTPVAQPSPEPSSNLVLADGWGEIILFANFAKTTLDIAAHFTTDRNACGKEVYGSLELEIWNTIAAQANAAVRTPVRAESDELCLAAPEQGKYMDGKADITGPSGTSAKRTLFNLRGGKICTTISDPAIAAPLLEALHKLVIRVDKEECPNGWGSG